MLLLAPKGDSLTPEHEHQPLSTQKRPLTTFGFLTAVFDKYHYRFRKPHGGCCLFRVGVGKESCSSMRRPRDRTGGGGIPLLSRTGFG